MTATAATFYSYPEFFESEDLHLDIQKGGTLENQNGDTMFVAYKLFYAEGVKMSVDFSKPPSLGVTIGICITMLVGVFLIGWNFYSMNHTDVAEIRSEVNSARSDSGSDVGKVRSENREDFGKVNEKLDKLTQMINDMRTEQARKDAQSANQPGH